MPRAPKKTIPLPDASPEVFNLVNKVLPLDVQAAIVDMLAKPGDPDTIERAAATMRRFSERAKAALDEKKYQDAYQNALALARDVGLTSLAALEYRATGKVTPLDAAATDSAKVPPKYQNPETGELWSGRGVPPVWMQHYIAVGRDKNEFLLPGAKPGRKPRVRRKPAE